MSTDTPTRPAVGDILSCGHVLTGVPFSTGYVYDRLTGDTFCYPCGDDRERAAFAAAGRAGEPFGAYVNSAGDLTTWSGGVLARNVPHTGGVSRAGWNSSEIHSWRFRADDGSEWYGRNGGPGLFITVRRARRA